MEKVLTEVKQSIPASAARWIYKNLSRGRNGPLFDDVLVLTPTKEGARSLGAELLEMALNDGRPGVSGIRSITLETFLAELIGGSTNIASAPQKLLAWLYALKNSAAQELFPNGGPKGEPPIETAAELDALKSALSDKLMDFGDVLAFLKNGGDSPDFEIQMWQSLAEIERLYREFLAKSGLTCPFDALANAAKTARTDYKTIVLAALADAPSFMEETAKRLSKNARVIVLILANGASENDFDAIGRPLDAFENVEIPLNGENTFVFDSVAEEAAAAAKVAAEYGQETMAVGIACEQIQSAPVFKRAFQNISKKLGIGLSARIPEAESLSVSLSAKLFGIVGQLGQTGAFTSFFDFLQNPLIWATISENSPEKARAILACADRTREEYATVSGESALKILRLENNPLFQEFERAASIAKKLLSADIEDVVSTLEELVQNYESFAGESRMENDACQALRAVAESVGSLKDYRPSQSQTMALIQRAFGAKSTVEPDMENAIALQNWVEIFWSRAPQILLCDMNEGVVPMPENQNQFMSQSLKRRMGLKDSQWRRRRDAYMLKAMLDSRPGGLACVMYSVRDASGDPRMPSRILMQARDLPSRINFLLETPPQSASETTASTPVALRADKPLPQGFRMSATAFKNYLSSPVTFYILNVLKASEIQSDKSQMDAMQFGTLFHETLRRWASSECAGSEDADEIAKYLDGALSAAAAEKFKNEMSAQTRLQLVSMRQRLRAVAKRQAQWAMEGWRIWGSPERKISMQLDGMEIVGTIDRIDFNAKTGDFAVIDYKTYDTLKGARQTHVKDAPDGSLQWLDLQLPIYVMAARELANKKDICRAALFVAPTNVTATDIDIWEISHIELESAVLKMREIISKIRNGEFATADAPKYPPCPDTFNLSGKQIIKLLK